MKDLNTQLHELLVEFGVPDQTRVVVQLTSAVGLTDATLKHLKPTHLKAAGVPELVAFEIAERLKKSRGVDAEGLLGLLITTFDHHASTEARRAGVQAIAKELGTADCMVLVDGKPSRSMTSALITEMLNFGARPPTWEGHPVVSLQRLIDDARGARLHDPVTGQLLSPSGVNNHTLVSWAGIPVEVLAIVRFCASKDMGAVASDRGASFADAYRKNKAENVGWFAVAQMAYGALPRPEQTAYEAAVRYDPAKQRTDAPLEAAQMRSSEFGRVFGDPPQVQRVTKSVDYSDYMPEGTPGKGWGSKALITAIKGGDHDAYLALYAEDARSSVTKAVTGRRKSIEAEGARTDNDATFRSTPAGDSA